jgi:uncharacterized protein
MVKIEVGKIANRIKKMEIKGHAGFADKDNDIVCAGISSVSVGLLNAIDELTDQSCDIVCDDNYIRIVVLNDDDVIQTILSVGLIQLKTIEDQFPQNLKIKITEV